MIDSRSRSCIWQSLLRAVLSYVLLLGDLDHCLDLAVCLLDPVVWPLDSAVWPLDPAVWPLDPAVWPLDPAVLPLDRLICGCGYAGVWFVHGGMQCQSASVIVEMARCLHLDVWQCCTLVILYLPGG